MTRVVKAFKIDCVIRPGLMGHKHGAASLGIITQVCPDPGVPFLTTGFDLYDPRYATVNAMKDQLSQFFIAM